MKVGILITGLGIGGAENHLLKVLPRLSVDNFVISLTDVDDLGGKLEKKGVRIYYLGFKWWNIFSVIGRFFKVVRKEKPSVLDTYLIHANIFGRIFGKLMGLRVVNSVRNDYSDLKFLSLLDKMTRWMVDLFVVNSRSLAKNFKRVGVLPNCIDLDNIKIGRMKNFSGKTIIFHGRLEEQKRLDTLVEALKYLDEDFKVVLIGDGPYRKRLEGISRVEILGKIKDKSTLYGYIKSCDVYALPSRKEGMSNSLLEAMALEKVCVVSNIPQNKELIKDYVNGLVFKLGDPKDLAEKIKEAVKKNDYGKIAREKIRKEHDVKEIVKQYEEILRCVES